MRFTDLKIGHRLLLGFGIIIFLVAIIGVIAIININTLSNRINDLYKHPYTVSTALLRIDGNIGRMEQLGSHLIDSSSSEESQMLIEQMALITNVIVKDFKTIGDRYLGDKAAIRKAEEQFSQWQLLQDEIVGLVQEDAVDTHIADKQLEAELIAAELRNNMQEFTQLADKRAANFLASANESSENIFYVMTGLLFFILGVAAITAAWITNSITRPVDHAVALTNRLAQGDLTVHANIEHDDEIGKLLTSMMHMVNKLREVVCGVALTAENVASISKSLDQSSHELSTGASEQAKSVEAIVISMEQMNSIIMKNSENADQTTQIATQASNNAEDGAAYVIKVVNSIKDIAKSIEVIVDIAEQTNLLAINAEIEAARAGSSGSGFSVVANEVRKLAEMSQESAASITKMTRGSERDAEESSQLLEKMVADIQETAQLIRQISTSSQEQKEGVSQVNQAIHMLDQVVQENLSGSEDMASRSRELSSEAQQLQNSVDFFKLS